LNQGALLIQFSKDRATGRAIRAGKFHRRANQLITPRRNLRQIDALEEHYTLIEECPVNRHLFIGMSR
jgi:hypothetical protein